MLQMSAEIFDNFFAMIRASPLLRQLTQGEKYLEPPSLGGVSNEGFSAPCCRFVDVLVLGRHSAKVLLRLRSSMRCHLNCYAMSRSCNFVFFLSYFKCSSWYKPA